MRNFPLKKDTDVSVSRVHSVITVRHQSPLNQSAFL